MNTKLKIYFALAALPVLLDWLNDSVKLILAGQQPVMHWLIAAKLFFLMVYQCAVVWRAFLSNPNEIPPNENTTPKPPVNP